MDGTTASVAKMFRGACERWGDRVAIRQKRYGIWEGYTWRQYHDAVKALALGLVSLGLKPGGKVMIVGKPEPEWVFSCLATACARGVVTAGFEDSLPDEIAYIFDHSEATIAIVEDQEQVDKILEVTDHLPRLLKVIYWDRNGMWGYDDPRLATFQDVVELGKAYERDNPGIFERNVEETAGDDPFGIWYTPGTTGRPKGAIMSNRSMLAAAESWNALAPSSPSDQYFARGPLCMVTDLYAGCVAAFTKGFAVNFPEGPKSVDHDLREIGPRKLFVDSRILEAQLTDLRKQLERVTAIKRLAASLSLPVGRHLATIGSSGRKPNWLWRALGSLTDLLFFRPLLDQMGYAKCNLIVAGGAPLAADTFHYLLALGLNVKAAYGLLECPLVTVHKDLPLPDTAGEIMAERGAGLRITEAGEVCVRGPQMTDGYHRVPEGGTLIDADGWLHTGDAGRLNEQGQLVIFGRLADALAGRGGSVVYPEQIERRLRQSPYVQDAVVTGASGGPLSVLVGLDLIRVAAYMEGLGFGVTNAASLSQEALVRELIEVEIEKVNAQLPEAQSVSRFVVLPKRLDADDGEITRPGGLRRKAVLEKYAGLIEALNGGLGEYALDTDMIIGDGERTVARVPVSINTVAKLDQVAARDRVTDHGRKPDRAQTTGGG